MNKKLTLQGMLPIISLFFILAILAQISHLYSQDTQEPSNASSEEQEFVPENQEIEANPNTMATEYYKIFKEHFYKEDEFMEQVANPKEESYFFIVKKNTKDKILNVGYYNQEESDSGDKRFVLAQYVSQEGVAYYYVTYTYNTNLQLVKKEFKDKNDKVIYYYQYIWDRNNLLKSLEKYGKTKYLGQMELKSYNQYQWNDQENLKSLTYYDKTRSIVEKYFFFSNPNSGEDTSPQFLVGNNKISMFVLDKYERYHLSSDNKKTRSYYIQYQVNNNKIFQEKYNHDNVLIEELLPMNVPNQEIEDTL